MKDLPYTADSADVICVWGMSKATILVIDDDRQVCGYIKTVLEIAGFAVQSVLSAEDAEQMLVNCSFDLILLDYGLPGRNGDEFLRNAAIPGSTKVILITSKLSREIVKSMFDLGI
jgi:two-component system, OmpR family, KDP operon response regulator KdpE